MLWASHPGAGRVPEGTSVVDEPELGSAAVRPAGRGAAAPDVASRDPDWTIGAESAGALTSLRAASAEAGAAAATSNAASASAHEIIAESASAIRDALNLSRDPV